MDFKELESSVTKLNSAFEENTAKAINKNVTARNWLIGFYIVNYEQHGEDRAAYGERTLQPLSERLNQKSFSYRNLRLYRQFYLEFPVLEKPIYEYVLNEFHTEDRLVENINQNLLVDRSMGTDLANTVCQIQAPIVQTPSAQLTDPELQIPLTRAFYGFKQNEIQKLEKYMSACMSFLKISILETKIEQTNLSNSNYSPVSSDEKVLETLEIMKNEAEKRCKAVNELIFSLDNNCKHRFSWEKDKAIVDGYSFSTNDVSIQNFFENNTYSEESK